MLSEMQQTVMEKLESGAGEKEALRAGLKDAAISQIKLTEILKKFNVNTGVEYIDSDMLSDAVKYIIDYIGQQSVKDFS